MAVIMARALLLAFAAGALAVPPTIVPPYLATFKELDTPVLAAQPMPYDPRNITGDSECVGGRLVD
jgi:hypothetical protein